MIIPYSIFLSVVLVMRNHAGELEQVLTEATRLLSSLVKDYELIIVENASNDDSIAVLKRLTGETGLPNLQIYALPKEVDIYTAHWVGIENALGDFVASLDPFTEDIGFLSELLAKAMDGADVVFAQNQQKPLQRLPYRIAHTCFHVIYRYFQGIDLAKDAPYYRLLNRRVVNFILQHPQPAVAYQYLPATAGFCRTKLNYSAKPKGVPVKRLRTSMDRGMQLLVSSTRTPLRMAAALSLFGAVFNILYSFYVVSVLIFKNNVAPGWASLSLQQSGMFFLISFVLYMLGEYILHVITLTNEKPICHIGQEFMNVHIGHHKKLNIEGSK